MQTIRRTKSEKVKIGETIMFFAMMGVHIVPPLNGRGMGKQYDSVELAHYLADDPRRVRRWWADCNTDEKLYILQEIQPPGGWDQRITDRWRDMRPEIQDQWSRQVSAACRARLEYLASVTWRAIEQEGAA